MKVFAVGDAWRPPSSLAEKLAAAYKFEVEFERAGVHDLDFDDQVLRGYFSVVTPFEVEHLVDGITTKSLFKRIEGCEFAFVRGALVAWGKSEPVKCLAVAMANCLGQPVSPVEWSTDQLFDIQGRMTQVKSVSIIQSKDQPIRRARLAGDLDEDSYSDVVDPRGVESVSGVVESPIGPVTLAVGRKGTLRWGVKKGFVLTVECIEWVLALLADSAEIPAEHRADERLGNAIRKWDRDAAGCRVEVGVGDGTPAVIGVGSKIVGGS